MSILIHTGDPLEGRVSGSAWVTGTTGTDGINLDLPKSFFAAGLNTIEVRSTEGLGEVSITTKEVWMSEYNHFENGDISFNFDIQASLQGANDVVVSVPTHKEGNYYQEIRILPDNNNHIRIDGLVDPYGFHIETELYEPYHIPFKTTFDITVNLRKIVAGTKIYGKFLKKTDNGDVPFAENDGTVYIHPHHPLGNLYICADASSIGDDRYNWETGDYYIDRLAGGIYDILTFWVNVGIEQNIATINLNPGTAQEVNITLEGRNGILNGTIVDTNSSPLAGYYARIYTQLDWADSVIEYYTDTVTSNAEGNFSIEAFYGDYTLLISQSDPDISDPAGADAVQAVTIGTAPASVTVTVN